LVKTPNEACDSRPDLVGAVFLDEVRAFDGDFGLVWPAPAERALAAD
jgi:hypothetical protein